MSVRHTSDTVLAAYSWCQLQDAESAGYDMCSVSRTTIPRTWTNVLSSTNMRTAPWHLNTVSSLFRSPDDDTLGNEPLLCNCQWTVFNTRRSEILFVWIWFWYSSTAAFAVSLKRLLYKVHIRRFPFESVNSIFRVPFGNEVTQIHKLTAFSGRQKAASDQCSISTRPHPLERMYWNYIGQQLRNY